MGSGVGWSWTFVVIAAGEALDSQGDGAMVEKGTGLRATQLLKLTALNSSLTGGHIARKSPDSEPSHTGYARRFIRSCY